MSGSRNKISVMSRGGDAKAPVGVPESALQLAEFVASTGTE